MLNFKNTLIAFFVILAFTGLADFVLPVSGWIYLGIILVLVFIIIWGSVTIQSNFFTQSLCCGNRNTRAVALTFDDGPDGQVTPMILDVLKEHNVKAAFFIIGKKAEQNPEVLKRIDAEGHIIGGHSYTHHFFFDLFSHRSMTVEMKRTSDIVFSIIGKRIQLFRPPYGVINPAVAKAMKSMNYTSIGWSFKSNDTVIKDDDLLLNRLISNVQKGDIILLHDNKTWLVKLLKTFIPYLQNKEFSIDRLDKFLNVQAYVF
jgi:peptidoglycan/xylan/chitin deacetylase (PgdA/CDA1 family)